MEDIKAVLQCYHPLGGRGFDVQQAHSIMAPFVEPIAISILVILAAVVAGGVAFLLD
jgi:hypothetical protein